MRLYGGPCVEFTEEEVEQSIPQRFEKTVLRYPNRLAIKKGVRSLTYKELNQAANRVARAIVETYGCVCQPVALLFEHGVDGITAILGVLKTGNFYVAVDPSFPLQRIIHTLEDSQAGLIVTNDRNIELALSLKTGNLGVLNIDTVNSALSPDDLGCSVSPDHIAMICYTSGSTGEAKGIVETHRFCLHHTMNYTGELRIGPEDRLTLVHSLSFLSAELHLYRALLNGASLFLFDIKSQGLLHLPEWLAEEAITVCHFSPAVFRQIAASLSGGEKLSNIRLIRLSGAPITRLDFDLYTKYSPPEALLELGMGSTETGTLCGAVVDRTFSFPKEGSPVGYPHPAKGIRLVDENGHSTKPGEIGEIAVKSRYLSSGYWRKPELTSSKFFPDSTGGDERIYLSGDLGSMMADGFMIHLGRKDFMVKIRGYRVELSEIEKTLLGHSKITDTGVVACERESGEKYLTAYIVPRQAPPPTINELTDYLKKRLPDWMIPSFFVFLESLPLTNGKLDRQALPNPEPIRPNLATAYVPPRTEVEERVAGIWADVLSVDRVGIFDNFLDLGGHSLLATRIIARVNATFGIEISIRNVLDVSTVAGVASIITALCESKKTEQGTLHAAPDEETGEL